MTPTLASSLTPLLRRLEPERAHRLAILAIRLGLAGSDPAPDDAALQVRVLGKLFSNPIGLAAGFDKEATAVRGLRRLGFGFVEAGTVVPRPQPGNLRPRVFRLEADRAVINRYGMNSQGLGAFLARLAALPRSAVPLGANVGINKEGADPVRDYPSLVAAVAPHVDYIVVNVSSPNTPGLRDLQGEARLREILAAVQAEVKVRPPMLIKIAPDLPPDGLAAIVANTTIARPETLRSPHRAETGGLSGPMLMAPSTSLLAQAHALATGRLVLIGCGGIASGTDILQKIRAGASLVQLYTAFAYEGPALIPRLKRELAAAMRAQGFATITEAIGAGL